MDGAPTVRSELERSQAGRTDGSWSMDEELTSRKTQRLLISGIEG